MKRAEEVAQSSETLRAAYEAYCGLCLAYAYGGQWAKTNRHEYGGKELQQLSRIIDTNRRDMRIALNFTRPAIAKAKSKLSPREISMTVEPASMAFNDQIAAMVGKRFLEQHLDRIVAVRHLRRANLWRCVLGSAIVRRSLSTAGVPIVVRDGSGQPVLDEAGAPMTIRGIEHDWAVCPPYEFLRDPSAHSPTFDGEDCIGQEKPVPLWWVKRNFPDLDLPEIKGTMGKLLEFQSFLDKATGMSWDRGWKDSKTPGVMFGEWWFRDDDTDRDQQWPWYMLTVRDCYNEADEHRRYRPVWFGKNPFHGLPLHHFWYETEPGRPWGTGIPILCMASQDALNIVSTMMLRQLIMHGSPKYIYQANSLEGNPADALSNRADIPIVYKQGFDAPRRLDTPGLDSNATTILGNAYGWMDTMLNQSPVGRGEAVKRGEPAKAYQIRREQADTVLNELSDDDELTINELLTGTLYDIVRLERTEVIQERLGKEFSANQITLLKMQDIAATAAGVRVAPDTVRPRTPSEMQEDFAFAIDREIVDPTTARRSMLLKGKISFNVKEERAYQKQIMEIQRMLSGDVADVAYGQDHETHLWALDLFTESEQWDALDDQQRELIQMHRQTHEEAQMMQAASNMTAQPQGIDGFQTPGGPPGAAAEAATADMM